MCDNCMATAEREAGGGAGERAGGEAGPSGSSGRADWGACAAELVTLLRQQQVWRGGSWNVRACKEEEEGRAGERAHSASAQATEKKVTLNQLVELWRSGKAPGGGKAARAMSRDDNEVIPDVMMRSLQAWYACSSIRAMSRDNSEAGDAGELLGHGGARELGAGRDGRWPRAV
jgi:hypothetical protein